MTVCVLSGIITTPCRFVDIASLGHAAIWVPEYLSIDTEEINV